MKARHILGLAVLMAVAGSCKKNQNQDTSSFSASIEVDESRTYLDEMKVKWSAGDQIIVYGDGAPNAPKTYTLSSGATTQTATFTTTGGVQPASTYRAFYPASSCRGVSGDVFTFSMPDTQTYTANGFMNNLNPMAGKNDGNGGTTLGFKNAFAVAKFSTKGNRSVSKIELEVPSGKYVSGTFTFNYADGTTTHSSGGTQVITLNCANPVDLNSTTEEDFYFVLPPGSIDNGFTIRYYQPNSNTPFATKTVEASTPGIALARNTIKTFHATAEAQVHYVHNLLPETVSDVLGSFNYWWDNVDIVNPDYTLASSSGCPSTLVNTKSIVVKPNTSYGEGYIYSKNKVHFNKDHIYYVRWYTLDQLNGENVTHDCYWPIAEPAFVSGSPCRRGVWKMHSIKRYANTPFETQDDFVRFDVNNNQFGQGGGWNGHHTFAGAMLIDLTEDYTNQGLDIPPSVDLNAKPYFIGQRDIDTW